MEILNLRVRYKPQEVGVFSGKSNRLCVYQTRYLLVIPYKYQAPIASLAVPLRQYDILSDAFHQNAQMHILRIFQT